jgi:hypothetical protein
LQAGICIELWVDRDPALPQTIAFLPEGRARAQRIGQLGLSRRLKLKPRPPDEVEAAFRDELRKGCPIARAGGRWASSMTAGGITGCAATRRAVRSASRSSRTRSPQRRRERAGLATGSRLTYRAFGEGSGRVEGAVVALAAAAARPGG